MFSNSNTKYLSKKEITTFDYFGIEPFKNMKCDYLLKFYYLAFAAIETFVVEMTLTWRPGCIRNIYS